MPECFICKKNIPIPPVQGWKPVHEACWKRYWRRQLVWGIVRAVVAAGVGILVGLLIIPRLGGG